MKTPYVQGSRPVCIPRAEATRRGMKNGQNRLGWKGPSLPTSDSTSQRLVGLGALSWSTSLFAARRDFFFHRRVESDRSDDSLPAWMPIEVTADSTSTSPPLAAARTGHIYMPPIPEIFAYDADGNLTSDSRWDYAWDAENRLVQMRARETAVTIGAPNLRLRFAYDYLSRRIQKTVEKEVGSYGSGTWELQSDTRFIYDGWNLVSEVEMKGDAADAPNAGIIQGGNTVFRPYLRRSYVWGPDVSGTEAGAGGVGGLLAVTRHERQGKAAESYWACWDLNGNVIGLASTTVSGRAAVYDYDAFGKMVRVNEPEAGLNPIRFSSKYTDEETGLVYYGYRYYSPEVGKWISRDPIEEKGGINLYGMVGNDAVNRVDVLGLLVENPNTYKVLAGLACADGPVVPVGDTVAVLLGYGIAVYEVSSLITEPILSSVIGSAPPLPALDVRDVSGLSEAEARRKLECADLHDEYKKLQKSHTDIRRAVKELLHEARQNRLDNRIDLCGKLRLYISIVNGELNGRQNYINKGCDDFDWFGSGTSVENRRGRHQKALEDIKKQLENLKKDMGKFCNS